MPSTWSTAIQRLVLGRCFSSCKYFQSWAEWDTEYLWQFHWMHQTSNEKSFWASHIWPPTQTITKFCTVNCGSTCLLSLVKLDLLLLLTSSSIWGMSPLPVPEWWEPCLVWLLGLGDLPWLNRTAVSWRCCCPASARDSAGSPFGSILLCAVSQERSCAAGWVLRGVFAVLPQCWLCCCLS